MERTEDGYDVGVDEAMEMAIGFQRRGRLPEAHEIYEKILAVAPNHPDALHFAGVLAQQQGRSREAVSLIERSLQLRPDCADWHSNLGIALKALGRVDEAVAAYRRAIELDPSQANAHCNLGVLLRAQGKIEEAEAAYRAAIRLNADHVESYHNLGILLAGQRRTKEAVLCYARVTTLCPKHPGARRLLALAYHTLGEPEKAAEVFERWLDEEPDNAVARHLLAACSGRDTPPRASDAYVETCFDNFASSFESKLEQLEYRAPAILHALLADAGLRAERGLDILDAGCGTGLCGSYLVPYARQLIGVDLSAGMLAQAREKEVYDDLVKAELTAYLREHVAAFDLVVSADTLCYFGVLEEFAAAAAAALRQGGLLLFTVEDWVKPEMTGTFLLQGNGRYRHARDYVQRVLTEAGLEPAIVGVELRMEAGEPVVGLAVRASKAARIPS